MFLAIMVLPRPLVPGEVAALADELEGEGALDEIALDLLVPVPVEIRHGLEASDSSPSPPALEAAAGPVDLLQPGDLLQDLGGGPAPFGGAGEEVVEGMGDRHQADLGRSRMRQGLTQPRRGRSCVVRRPGEPTRRPRGLTKAKLGSADPSHAHCSGSRGAADSNRGPNDPARAKASDYRLTIGQLEHLRHLCSITYAPAPGSQRSRWQTRRPERCARALGKRRCALLDPPVISCQNPGAQ